MRYLFLFIPLVMAIAAQAPGRDVPIPANDIATVEAIGSTVDITFSPETQSEALADDRELSIHLDFPLSADKALFISQARYVAHRLAAISFTLPSPEHARQFVQGIREGRVRLASHPKGLKPAQPTADRRTASLSMTKTHSFQVNLGSASGG